MASHVGDTWQAMWVTHGKPCVTMHGKGMHVSTCMALLKPIQGASHGLFVEARRAQFHFVGGAARRRRRKGKEKEEERRREREERKGEREEKKRKGKKKREEESGGREEKERGKGRSVVQ